MTAPYGGSELGLTLEELPQNIIADNTLEFDKALYGPKLVIRKISKSFPVPGGRVQALQDIDLTLSSGEFVCLVGPSGCGKSTLLNIIAGLEKPDAGEIYSYEEKAGPARLQNQRLLIFQEPSLFPWLTVFDNVAYGLKLRKMPKKEYETLTDRYLSLVQLSRFKDACIHQLSGGMKQRVALARALVLEPEILLMDEPFAALDIQTRKDMYELLLDIWEKTGTTILFITHNVDEALLLSNRVLVMTPNPGQIKKEFRLYMGYPRSMENNTLQKLRAEIFQQFTDDRTIKDLQGG
ncbi:MAG: ABC transporter ATP-binding protein [Bacillota bacterium]